MKRYLSFIVCIVLILLSNCIYACADTTVADCSAYFQNTTYSNGKAAVKLILNCPRATNANAFTLDFTIAFSKEGIYLDEAGLSNNGKTNSSRTVYLTGCNVDTDGNRVFDANGIYFHWKTGKSDNKKYNLQACISKDCTNNPIELTIPLSIPEDVTEAFTVNGTVGTGCFGIYPDYIYQTEPSYLYGELNITSATVSPTDGGATASATPSIDTQPTATASYTKGDTPAALSVEASVTDEGTLSYQWYSNTTASVEGATAISGATAASYTPSTAATGTTYYYCAVTNTKESLTPTTVNSEVAAVTVTAPVLNASAYLSNSSAASVLAGETFTADIYLKGEGIKSGDVTLVCTNGTIQSITTESGLGNTENLNNRLSFYNSTVNFTDGAKAATVLIKANDNLDPGTQVSLEISSASVGTGTVSNTAITLGENQSVVATVSQPLLYTVSDYAGKKLICYTGEVADGKAVKYNTNTDMYYSTKYEAWVCLVDETPADISNDSFTSVDMEESASRPSVNYDGNVNLDTLVNSTDMQLAYNIATAVFPDGLTDPMRLAADVTGNKAVTANDARNIQCIFHNLTSEPDSQEN